MYKITKQEDIINYIRADDYTYRLIVLKDKRFATCGRNKTIRIYKTNPIQLEVSIITRHSIEITDFFLFLRMLYLKLLLLFLYFHLK